MKHTVGMLFMLAGLAAGASIAQAQPTVLKPQQTFQFGPGAYGCLSKDELDAVYHHGEQQEMQRYFATYECLSTPEHSRFRAVRVDGHDVEFVNAENDDTRGLWANDRFIKQ
jgi:hypothetical protein